MEQAVVHQVAPYLLVHTDLVLLVVVDLAETVRRVLAAVEAVCKVAFQVHQLAVQAVVAPHLGVLRAEGGQTGVTGAIFIFLALLFILFPPQVVEAHLVFRHFFYIGAD
jgi:hypothetical protein